MRQTFISTALGEIPLSEKTPPSLQAYQLPAAASRSYIGSFGQVLLQQINTPAFSICVNSYQLTVPDSFTFTEAKDERFPYLLFNLSGNIEYSHHTLKTDPRLFHERGCNLIYRSVSPVTVRFRKPGHYTTVEISCPQEMLQTLSQEYAFIRTYLTAIQHQQPAICWEANQVTPQKVLSLLNKIFQPPVTAPLYNQYAEIKVIEIALEMLLHAARNLRQQPVSLSEREVDDIYRIRDFILRHLDKRYATEDLVTGTVLNPQTLKSGFRMLFGTGIYNFLAAARMEEGMKMMQHSDDIGTNHIAEALGYEDEISFLIAFRKYFGHRPLYNNR